MKMLLLKYWDRLRSSLWFIPTVMAGAAVVLAFAAVTLDATVADGWLQALGWRYTVGAEGASLLLGTVAGSMIAIASTVFPMTLVALSLASSHLGPRLLRNFMRATINQVVLGTFVATFVYCLLVLRTIRRADELAFVPHLSVSVGVLLASISLGVLIYFIHHVCVSIQVDEVIARVGRELMHGIDRLFPEHLGQPEPQPAVASNAPSLSAFEAESRPVGADGDGYLQRIDTDALMALASQEDLLLRLEHRPGHYVVKGRPLVTVWPGKRATNELAARINAVFVLGNQRTATQDIEFPVEQLVEIAARALSPGINDPFTAIACLDRLGSALCRLAQQDMPSPCRFDAQGRLRMLAPGSTFQGIVDAAFNQIRQYAGPSAAVSIRLLETITLIAAAARRPQDRAALRRHAVMIVRCARRSLPEEDDQQAVEARFQTAMLACQAIAAP